MQSTLTGLFVQVRTDAQPDGSLDGIVLQSPYEPFIPMMMFTIWFGLSMDYEVFILSRMKEEYESTGDVENSVADGLARTARVIAAAAAIMTVVFGNFVFEDDRIIKLFGLDHQAVRSGSGLGGVDRRFDRAHVARAVNHATAGR